MKQFVENFLIIFAAFVLQSYVIFPVEEYLRVDQNTDIVSFIYVPHGIKVALILAYGLSAAPAIIAGMIAINLLSAMEQQQQLLGREPMWSGFWVFHLYIFDSPLTQDVLLYCT